MLWRPSCPPFCKHVTDMSEINFNMLNRFLDLKNLCVATKSMCLAHILKKILRILSFGGHLGRHLEYFNFPMMPRWHHSVSMYGHIGEHIYAKTFCADNFFWLHPKSSFGNLTIAVQDLMEMEIFLTAYRVSLHIAFHYNPPIVLT